MVTVVSIHFWRDSEPLNLQRSTEGVVALVGSDSGGNSWKWSNDVKCSVLYLFFLAHSPWILTHGGSELDLGPLAADRHWQSKSRNWWDPGIASMPRSISATAIRTSFCEGDLGSRSPSLTLCDALVPSKSLNSRLQATTEFCPYGLMDLSPTSYTYNVGCLIITPYFFFKGGGQHSNRKFLEPYGWDHDMYLIDSPWFCWVFDGFWRDLVGFLILYHALWTRSEHEFFGNTKSKLG